MLANDNQDKTCDQLCSIKADYNSAEAVYIAG